MSLTEADILRIRDVFDGIAAGRDTEQGLRVEDIFFYMVRRTMRMRRRRRTCLLYRCIAAGLLDMMMMFCASIHAMHACIPHHHRSIPTRP